MCSGTMPPVKIIIESVQYSICWFFYQPWCFFFLFSVAICFSNPSPVSAWRFLSSRSSEIQLDRASALWMNFASFYLIWPCHFLVRRVEIKALVVVVVVVVVGNEAWEWASPEYVIDFISCCFQRSQRERPDRATGWYLRLPSTVVSVRTFAGYGDFFFPPSFLEPGVFFFFVRLFPARCG